MAIAPLNQTSKSVVETVNGRDPPIVLQPAVFSRNVFRSPPESVQPPLAASFYPIRKTSGLSLMSPSPSLSGELLSDVENENRTSPDKPLRTFDASLTPEIVELIRNPLPERETSTSPYDPALLPEWWNNTIFTVSEISNCNKLKPITSDQQQILDKKISVIKEKGTTKELLMLLKLLSEFIFIDSKKYFFDVLRTLRDKVSRIDDFIFDDPCGEPLDGPLLKPIAVQTLIHYFEKHYNYPSGVLSCQGVSNLPILVGKFIRSGEDGECRGWAIWNDQELKDPHIVPVFTFRRKGQLFLFIVDSIGHEISEISKKNSISKSLECLIDSFKGDEEIAKRLMIYSFKEKRQTGVVECSIFTLIDLQNLLQRHFQQPESLLQFYQNQSNALTTPLSVAKQLNAGSLQIYEINVLPPEMMKVTQSLSKLEQYRESPVHWETKLAISAQRFSATGDIVKEIQDFDMLDHKVSGCKSVNINDRPQNLYVEKKRLTFIVYLLASILDTKLDRSPLESRDGSECKSER